MKKLIKVYKSTQWAKDPEKHIHSPELYAIWNGKTCVMERVARENPFGSLYFLWVDIGSFRDTSWIPKKEWPDLERLDNIFSKSPRSVLVSSIGSLHRDITNKLTAQDGKWRSGENFLFHDRAFFVQGGAFGGRADALIEFFKYFWKTHDQFLRDGIFVGKDQLLFTHTTAFHKPRPLIMMSYRAERACGDIWFYFQQFLAADSDRKSGCKLVSMLTMDQFLVEALKT